MSFRRRLTLYFILITVVPMVSVAFVLFRLISDNENGKADARVAARQEVAIHLYEGAQNSAKRAAERVSKDPALSAALQTGDAAAATRRAQRLLAVDRARRIVIAEREAAFVDAGDRASVFPARSQLRYGSRVIGTLEVATEDAPTYAHRVQRVAGLEVVVRQDGDQIASTLPGTEGMRFPATQGVVHVAGEKYRTATFMAPGFLGRDTFVTVLDSRAEASSNLQGARLLAIGLVAGFLVLAFAFAIGVSRSMQSQVEDFYKAARRLGSGDFTTQIETVGHDEFAKLGAEFNRMSRELEVRLEELSEERERLQRSMQRIGETFASNLDSVALLEIVVRTAVEGVGADGGRALARSEPEAELKQVAREGELAQVGDAIRAAEELVFETAEPAHADVGNVHALAHPLRGGDGLVHVNGVVSVARSGRPFSQTERELFNYLAGQASVSVENVGLHETVERQAVTDELTGLFNRRRFEEVIGREVERSKRFGQQMALVMLDLDDFKQVNDTYGHQQGDVVLREVAKVLRESAREIDEPARYGGEELAVVLPGTDLDGAYSLAERVREGIEALEIRTVGDGDMLRVTASIGVAELPGSAADLRSLIAAADQALYEAKRTGKNKTVRAAAG